MRPRSLKSLLPPRVWEIQKLTLDTAAKRLGYRPKFGLASVDPVTFVRPAKPSAAVYGDCEARGALT